MQRRSGKRSPHARRCGDRSLRFLDLDAKQAMAKKNLNPMERIEDLGSRMMWGFIGALNQVIGVFTDKFARYFWDMEWDSFKDYESLNASWVTKQTRAGMQMHMFKALPYKANMQNRLDQEKKYIEMAMAASNHFYMSGDVVRYKKVVAEIGKFLKECEAEDHSFMSQSNARAEYLHALATICCIDGDPSHGALLNHQVSEIHENNSKVIECNRYRHCAICSKIESLNPHEQYLIDAFHEESRKIEAQLDAVAKPAADLQNKPEAAEASPEDGSNEREHLLDDYFRVKFEICITRCKIESYRVPPDINKLEEYINEMVHYGDEHKKANPGADHTSNELAIKYYQSFLNFLKYKRDKDPQMLVKAKREYKDCIVKINESKTPYLCHLRIPQSVVEELSNALNEPRLEFSIAPQKGLLAGYLKGTFILFSCFFTFLYFFDSVAFDYSKLKTWYEDPSKRNFLVAANFFLSYILARWLAWKTRKKEVISNWSGILTISTQLLDIVILLAIYMVYQNK
ncbi:MAG: hypothetical protein Q4A97_08830 [Comamonadaceae bacterium]|nr:hypothetical protein [Comamonadaceae bacterium]